MPSSYDARSNIDLYSVKRFKPRLCIVICFVILTASCASSTVNNTLLSTNDLASLTLPPNKSTNHVLQRLAELATYNSCAPSWYRAQYLLDLFDFTRIVESRKISTSNGPQPGLALLWRSIFMRGTPAQGRIATEQVLSALNKVVDAIPRSCPQRLLANTALTLLKLDQSPRSFLSQALQIANSYKKIARSKSPLAPNALLRLVDWCGQAFRNAAGGIPALGQQNLNHCLYPLFDSDPAPYFEENPANRPPDPPWTLLRHTMEKMREQLLSTRLAAIGNALTESDNAFFLYASSELPCAVNMQLLELPLSQYGDPWDRTPVITITKHGYLIDNLTAFEDDSETLENALHQRLYNDARRKITVVALPHTKAERILSLAAVAKRAGIIVLGLGVRRDIADKPPHTDVQALIAPNGPVLRLEEIPLFISLITTSGHIFSSRNSPRGITYDADTSPNGLAITISTDNVIASSNDGFIPPTSHDQIPSLIEKLRKNYPQDASLLVAVDPEITYRKLALALAQIRAAAQKAHFVGMSLISSRNYSLPDKEYKHSQ